MALLFGGDEEFETEPTSQSGPAQKKPKANDNAAKEEECGEDLLQFEYFGSLLNRS